MKIQCEIMDRKTRKPIGTANVREETYADYQQGVIGDVQKIGKFFRSVCRADELLHDDEIKKLNIDRKTLVWVDVA